MIKNETDKTRFMGSVTQKGCRLRLNTIFDFFTAILFRLIVAPLLLFSLGAFYAFV